MNFRWSNIYVLQFLVVLNVNGLKLVPADRTVIKQNGTTRTISRYYLLPHSDEPKGFRLGNTLTGDGGFTKFLREFEKKNEKKKSQPGGNKKIVDRYRIYIKRKLKKNKNEDAKPASEGKAPEKKPEDVSTSSSTTSTSIETIDNSTGPPKIRTQYNTSPTPVTSNESDDEYTITKKNVEVTALLPKLVIEQKTKGTSEPNETKELVWRTNEADDASVEESVNDQNADQDPYKILMEATAAQALKNPVGKVNATKDTGEEKLKQSDLDSFPDMTKTRSSEEKDFGNATDLKASQNTTSPESEQPISAAELNKLYSQLYGQYTPETPIKPDENSYKHEPKSRQGQINIVVDDMQVGQDVQHRPEDEEAFKNLLSALHRTPENFPNEAKKINPEQYNDMYKNPLEEKELKDKSAELTYDDVEDLHGFDLPSSLLTNSYDMTDVKEVSDGSAKVKEKNPSLTLHDLLSKEPSSTTSVQNNDQGRTKNPLETYFETFGNQNHDSLFDETPDYVDDVITSPSTSSTVGYDQSSSAKDTTEIPPISDYNSASIKHTESVRIPSTLGFNQDTPEYSETVDNIPILGYNQANLGQIAPVAKRPRLGYNQVNVDDSKLVGSSPVSSNNHGNPEYAKPINKPPILGYNKANLGLAAPIGVVSASEHNQGNVDNLKLGDPPISGYDYSNPEYLGVINKPPLLGYNQASLGKSVPVSNLPVSGYNKASVDNADDVSIPTTFGYNQASTEYSEPVRKPPSLGYNPASLGQLVSVSNQAGLGYNQDNLNPEVNSPVVGYNQESTEFSEPIRKPPVLGKHSLPSGDSPIVGYSQTFEYSETSGNPPVAAYNQDGVEYSKPVANPPASGFNLAGTKNADTMTNTYSLGSNDAENEYPHSIGNPLALDNQGGTGYSETSRTPLNEEINSSPSGESHSKYPLLGDENVGSSSSSSFMNHNQYNSTQEKKLRGGTGNEWVYQEAAAEEEYISKKPNIEIDTNLVQIGAGVDVINYPILNNQPTFQDLASMCPECFKRIYAELMHKEQSGVTHDSNISILKLFKDSSLFSYLQSQNQHESQVNHGSSLSSSINNQGIIEFIQNLENQNHQQASHSTPEKDQSLVKILEIVLKGNEAETAANVQDTSFPNIQLFTIENLKKVLEVLERNGHLQTDKETSNLYKIIKLIFETAKRQVAATGNDAGGVSWFTRLNNFMGSPLKKYVYNLLRQTWLQEIMGHLYNNNYNLNVIRNPRWAAYLGAWRLPIQLLNANSEYYDQNEYTADYDGHGEFYQETESVNPQSDASVILALLKQYLVSAQYYEQDGSVDYYRKQTELFSRIAAFLRQRGYAVQIIEKLIRKLYAVLNANRALVTINRPSCMTTRH